MSVIPSGLQSPRNLLLDCGVQISVTLEELENSLPNGFHDAMVSRLHLDYVGRIATFDVAISIGTPDAKTQEERDGYRNAQLVITGLHYAVIDPPDPNYAYSKSASLMIDACESGGRIDSKLLASLPPDAFAGSFFVSNWNAFVHVAGSEAEIRWIAQPDTRLS